MLAQPVRLLFALAASALLVACGGALDALPPGTSPTPKVATKGGGGVPPADETAAPTPSSVPTPIVIPDGGFPWPPYIGQLLQQELLRLRIADYLRAGGPPPLLLEVEYYTAVPRADVIFANPERDRLYYDFASGTRVGPCDVNDYYPLPCTYFAIVRPGAEITFVAGDSRAGYWPRLERSEGSAECTRSQPFPSDTVELCKVKMSNHLKLKVYWSGGESPGLLHFVYPTCPTNRPPPGDPRTPAFVSRCQ